MRLFLLAALMMATPAVAQDYTGAKGTCEKFVLAGKKAKCGGVAILSQTANGRGQAQITKSNDEILMFSGTKDSGPDGFPAIKVDTVADGKNRLKARGGCLVHADGKVLIIGCDANDKNGQPYSAYFRGNVKR